MNKLGHIKASIGMLNEKSVGGGHGTCIPRVGEILPRCPHVMKMVSKTISKQDVCTRLLMVKMKIFQTCSI